VRLLDAEHHKRLGNVVGQLGLVVEVQLLEAFENVIEAAQTSAPFGFTGPQHR